MSACAAAGRVRRCGSARPTRTAAVARIPDPAPGVTQRLRVGEIGGGPPVLLLEAPAFRDISLKDAGAAIGARIDPVLDPLCQRRVIVLMDHRLPVLHDPRSTASTGGVRESKSLLVSL